MQLFVIITVNIYGLLEGYYGYYYGPKYNRGTLYKISENISYSNPIAFYSTYTGTATTYGFYAPNVASQFLMNFIVFDKNGKQLDVRISPNFKHKESKHRFALCTSIMMDKMEIKQSKMINEPLDGYIKVMLHEIAMNIKKEYTGAYKIFANVFLHEFPSIKEFKAGKKEKIILVDKYQF